MLKARPGKEVVIKVRNQIGVLAQLTKVVAEKGINILSASAWVIGPDAFVHMVTDDNLRAMDALRAKSYDPREIDVVLTEVAHKPGMLRHISEKLSQSDIDLHHLYATAASDQDKCLVVFATSQNDRAVVLLNE